MLSNLCARRCESSIELCFIGGKMRKSIGVAAIALLLVTSFVVPTFAKPYSRIVTLTTPEMVGNTQLVAGDYQLTVTGNKIALVRDHKLITEALGRWESRREVFGATAIIGDSTGQLREIQFQGDTRALVISSMY
jgi:hypothetical protein